MNIANIGAFAGGLQRGYLNAEEEARRQESQEFARQNQAFARDQMAAWRDEQARRERIRQGVAGIARPGSIGMTGADMEGAPEPVMNKTEQTYLRELGNVYAREGDIDRAFLMGDRQYVLGQRAFEEGQRDFQLGQQRRTLGQQGAADRALSMRAQMLQELDADPNAFVGKYAPMFNADRIGGPEHAGSMVSFANTPNGQVGFLIRPDGRVGGQFPVTRDALMAIVNGLTDEALAGTSPEAFGAYSTRAENRDFRNQTIGVQRLTAEAAMRNAQTNEQYRRDLINKPITGQDGLGRLVTLSPDGTRQLGVYGAARPAGGADAGRQLPPNVIKELNDAAQAVDSAKTPQERQAAQQRYNNLYSNAATLLGKVVPPREIKGAYAGGAEVTQFDLMRQSIMGNKDLDPAGKMQQLAQVDKIQTATELAPQVAQLQPDERVPQLREMFQRGIAQRFSNEELMKTFGFTAVEIQAARKPAATAQTPSGASKGGTATREPAPASVPGDKQGLARPARMEGEALPAYRARLVEWDKQQAALERARVAEEVQRMGAGLRRPLVDGQ